MMRLRISAGLAALALAATPALAGPSAEVNAQDFYTRALELKAKGMGAVFAKGFRSSMAQMQDAGKKASSANNAATKAGKPLYCVSDAERKKGLDADKVIAILGRLGLQTRQKLTLDKAWMAALQREYPCK